MGGKEIERDYAHTHVFLKKKNGLKVPQTAELVLEVKPFISIRETTPNFTARLCSPTCMHANDMQTK